VGVMYSSSLSAAVFTDVFWRNEAPVQNTVPYEYLKHPWRIGLREYRGITRYTIAAGLIHNGTSLYGEDALAETDMVAGTSLYITLVVKYLNSTSTPSSSIDISTTGYKASDYQLDVVSDTAGAVSWVGWSETAIPIGAVLSDGSIFQRLYDMVILPYGMTVSVPQVLDVSASSSELSSVKLTKTYICGNLVDVSNPYDSSIIGIGACPTE